MGRVDQLRAQVQLEHGDLEEVFLKLTGDADFAPLLDSLRGKALRPIGLFFYSETISIELLDGSLIKSTQCRKSGGIMHKRRISISLIRRIEGVAFSPLSVFIGVHLWLLFF